jgi:hypothetical protein
MSIQCATNDQVAISKGAFIFCRYSMAVLVWLAFILRIKILVAVLCGLLVLSALLTVRRAPLVWLYTVTINRLFPSPDEWLSVAGMRVAHTMGAIFAALCLVFLYKISEPVGWWLTLAYCVVKTISAIWACPVYKLYACMKSGNCCTFLKRKP